MEAKKMLLVIPLLLVVNWAQVIAMDRRQTSLSDGSETINMLDSLQEMISGKKNDKFDRVVYAKMISCMKRLDSRIPESHNGIYKAWGDYWLLSPQKWGENDIFKEEGSRHISYLNMTIAEPCNTVSNFAYYHLFNEYCTRIAIGTDFNIPEEYEKKIGIALSQLAPASAFMHGSTTSFAGEQDWASIDILGYLLYQSFASHLPTSSSVIQDLSVTPRDISALGFAEKYIKITLTLPVSEWELTGKDNSPVDITQSMIGLFTTSLYLIDSKLGDALSFTIINLLELSEDLTNFLENDYIPQVKQIANRLNLDLATRYKLFTKLLTPSLKFLYAFVWQEMVISIADDVKGLNAIGYALTPIVNQLANKFAKNEYFDESFQTGKKVYPDEKKCAVSVAHCKWHVTSTIATLDLVYYVDELIGVVADAVRDHGKTEQSTMDWFLEKIGFM